MKFLIYYSINLCYMNFWLKDFIFCNTCLFTPNFKLKCAYFFGFLKQGSKGYNLLDTWDFMKWIKGLRDYNANEIASTPFLEFREMSIKKLICFYTNSKKKTFYIKGTLRGATVRERERVVVTTFIRLRECVVFDLCVFFLFFTFAVTFFKLICISSNFALKTQCNILTL